MSNFPPEPTDYFEITIDTRALGNTLLKMIADAHGLMAAELEDPDSFLLKEAALNREISRRVEASDNSILRSCM